MSSRDYLKHIVDSSSARATNPGDEYWDPVNNKLYKTVLTNGTTTTKTEVALGGSSPVFTTLTSLVKTSLNGDINIGSGSGITAITRTGNGSGYTSIPTLNISAPTSANGTQAKAIVYQVFANIATVVSSGSGYTNGDVVTVQGGTGVAATYTATVVGGAITSVTPLNFATYTAVPSNPVSVTGGTGSGATLNVTYGIQNSFTITDPGSGYIEQPTITFSGDGTGAAAYATLGSNTLIKSISNITTFTTPNSQVLALVDKNSAGNYPVNTTPAFSMVPPQNAFGPSYFGMLAGGYFATSSSSFSSAYIFATGIAAPLTSGGGGSSQFQIGHVSSAVNYVQVTGAATGVSPLISSQGSDANPALGLTSKGTGAIRFSSGNASYLQFRIGGGNSAVNNLAVNGNVAGSAPILSSEGSDTNIPIAFQSKGTGAIDLAAGSQGINISNGGTVTAITGVTSGSYTTIPTITISPPTTAGGVQATGTVAMQLLTGSTIASPGTGYAIGDTITLAGGTFSAAAVLTVATLSGSGVATYTTSNAGTYTVLPTSPITTTTSGSGTGFTLTGLWGVRTTAYTVTAAGSGYVEQPTVTFSSGTATAYAAIGGGTVIRSLGQTGIQALDFYTPSSIIASVPALRIRDGTTDSYPMIWGYSSSANIFAQGGANATMRIGCAGSGTVTLSTNGTSPADQVKVAHTASVVNWIQLTGSPTGATSSAYASITFTGADAIVGGAIVTKGNGSSLIFSCGSTGSTNLVVKGGTNGLTTGNVLQISGAIAGASPTISAIVGPGGSDANIDITLTPKGTGSVVATSPVKLQGYTVATLPTAGVAGRIAYVTDATSPTYLGALTGGGAVTAPVFDNGTAWVSH